MTEPEWMGCEDPRRLFEFYGGRISRRKRSLFSLALGRRHCRLLGPGPEKYFTPEQEAYWLEEAEHIVA